MFEKNHQDKKEKDGMHIETDNLAIPEVRFGKEEQDEAEDNESSIDYSGAIPQIHIVKR